MKSHQLEINKLHTTVIINKHNSFVNLFSNIFMKDFLMSKIMKKSVRQAIVPGVQVGSAVKAKWNIHHGNKRILQ